MNMILHNNPIAVIEQGNTLTSPSSGGGTLKTFDYVVAIRRLVQTLEHRHLTSQR